MPNPATQEERVIPPVELAWKSSQRSRTTRATIKRLREAPPLTREQRQQIIEAAISLPVLDEK